MEINGIAHIQLTLNHFKEHLPFYKKLLGFFDMKLMFGSEDFYYCVGGRTGIAISPSDPKYRDEPFDQKRAGLHHLCFRLRQKDDVDKLADFIREIGGKVVRAPAQQDHWAPGMYSVLFEDPEGIRLEANYVPGKGNLDPSVDLPKKW